MKITKAVIPAAGLGTRVLPATKAMPKEMFPIVDKPAIQYIVEEAVKAGITDILIITNRGKGVIEDHFDRAPELEAALDKPEKQEILETVKNISKLANITFIRQVETKGLGHAILRAKNFVGNEPFAVMYGDDVIIGENPAIGELIESYGEYGKGVVGVKLVPETEIHKYGSLAVENIHDNIYKCTDMVEKPQTPEEVLSCYSILGRCVLPPEIFEILENTKPGKGGEIQLTDAMKEIAITQEQVPSNRGYPGDLYSQLAARYEKAVDFADSGSVTVLAVTTMPGDDVTHPVPDNTGYITEGQYYLKGGRIEPFGSLSRLKQNVNGKTRKDHRALMDAMIRLYSSYKETLEKKNMGFSMSRWDEKLLKYGELFECKMMSLSVNLSLEEALDLGWEILADCFDKDETGIKSDITDEFWPKK